MAAVKSALERKKKPNSLTLLLYLINAESIELVGNELLAAEYRRYSALSPTAKNLLTRLLEKTWIVGYDESLNLCIPYFPPSSIADAMHAATCLKDKSHSHN